MNESKNWVIGLVAVVALALGTGLWLLKSSGTEGENTAAVGNLKQVSLTDDLKVNDQFPGAIVYVNAVTLEAGGWVVVKKTDGTIIGTQYFNPGTDVGVVNLTELTEEGKTYITSLHKDNGDKVFDPINDLPLKNSNGQEIAVTFFATQNLPEVKG